MRAWVAMVGATMLAACEGPSTMANPAMQAPSPAASLVGGSPALVARGESLFYASEFDSAEATWTRALGAARTNADIATEARVLTWLGLSARSRGDGVVARQHLEAGLDLKLRHLAGDGAGESYNALGLLALDEDRNVDARDAFQQALASAGDRHLVAKATGNLGLTLAHLGDLTQARRHIQAMHDSSVALGERRFQANALANLAMLDIWLGRAADALAVLERARAIYRELDYAPGEQNALGQLAVAYEGLGSYGAAFAALDSSLAIARAKGMREDEGEILRLIAGLHARVGDLPAALRQYEIALQVADSNRAAGEGGSIRRRMAGIHLVLDNIERARRDATAALEAHRATGARIDEVDDLLTLADVERHAGDATAARLRMGEAGRLAASLGVPSLRRSVALQEARVAESRGEPRAVLRALRGLEAEAAQLDVAQAADAAAMAARAWAQLSRLDSATAAGARAMAFLGRLRADLASEPLRRALIADRARVYADQVVALLRRGRTDDAFAVADAGRSRGLVDHLASARTQLSTADRPPSAEGEQLLREIDVVLRLLRDAERVPPRERSAGAAANGDALSRRLDEARSRYESFLHRTARAPSRRSTLLGATTVDPGRVRAAIGPDERVLEYMVAEDRIVLFVASRDSIHAIERPADLRAITERIRVLRETWGTRDAGWQVALPAARALYRELLAPAREAGLLEGARRLVVVPHGVLSQVPFAALRGGADRWLVEDFELLYVPSAAALPALRAPHAPLPRTSALAAFAPFPRELPATRDEARSVQRGAAGATLAMGATATEAAVRSALAEGRVVHVATHGVMNSRNPLFSRVELARGRGAPQGDDDGRLEVHELLGMTVASPLVFLSGCETSAFQAWLDDPVRGTDHATLAQAFLQAGAENVAGTLWRIDDGGAAAFAAAFHERLRRADPVAALAAAQRRFIADAGYGNPYYWASYLVVGSGRLPASAEKSRGPSVSYGRQAVREPLPLEP